MEHKVDFYKVFVAIILVVSLGINFTLLSKFGQLENQMNGFSDSQYQIMDTVDNQSNNMHQILNDFKEEQSWISSITMDLNKENLVDEQLEVTFQWQVKELHNDSKVIFNYKFGDGVAYTVIEAEEVENGLFQVKVPFEFELEPMWAGVTIGSSEGDSSVQEFSEKMIEEQQLNYFVSVTYEDINKNSELQTEYLDYVGTSYYGELQTDIYMDKNTFDVMLMNYPGEDTSVFVEEAYLQKYENNTFVGEDKLQADNYNVEEEMGMRFFQLNQLEQYDDMRLVLKVVYNNGDTFEKEVY